MKHTKGPWEIVKQEKDVFGEMPILIVGQRPGANENFGDVIAELCETGRQEYDSRLIAAAPDLLELLNEARDSVAECANYEAQYESHRPDRAISTMKTLEKIDSILATLTGE